MKTNKKCINCSHCKSEIKRTYVGKFWIYTNILKCTKTNIQVVADRYCDNYNPLSIIKI